MISQSFFFFAVILTGCTLSFAAPDPWKAAAPSLDKSKPSDSTSQNGTAKGFSTAGIFDSGNREGFVKNLANDAFYGAGQKYNVMVFNLAQPHKRDLRGVKSYKSASYGSVVYGIWVFEYGTFHNEGDGGYINWAFIGWFDRYGGVVNFRKP